MSLFELKTNRRDQSQPKFPYPNSSLRWDLTRVHDTWRESRRQHDRFSVYEYLTAVFDLVMVWDKENRAVDRATRALRLKGRNGGNPEVGQGFEISYGAGAVAPEGT